MSGANADRLVSNKDITMRNVAAYAKRILPYALSDKVDRDIIREDFSNLLDELLGKASSAVNGRRYSEALDILEEAKDAACGIKWAKLKDSKHPDESIDLIRDATMQEYVLQNTATQDHVMKLIRCVSLLRSTEEVMKSTKRGSKAVEKSHFIESDLSYNISKLSGGKNNKAEKQDADSESKDAKRKQGFCETKIFKCNKILVEAIKSSAFAKTHGGYAFEEQDYIKSLRHAMKKESGIKNKNAKIDWVRKNIAIQDHQYHTTTLTKQRDKEDVPVIISESSIMMLGFSRIQVKTYEMIKEAEGRKAAPVPPNTGNNGDTIEYSHELEIINHYNKMTANQRKIISNIAAQYVVSQNKVVPSCSDGIDTIKNPRLDMVVAHQEFRAPDKVPEVKSFEIGHSYSIDGLNETPNTTTDKIRQFFTGDQAINSKIEQLKDFFSDEQKLNINILGKPKLRLGFINLFSKNRPLYNALSNYSKNDSSVSVDAFSMKSGNFSNLHSVLRKAGHLMEKDCVAKSKTLLKEIAKITSDAHKMPLNSPQRLKTESEILLKQERISELDSLKKITGCIAYNKNTKSLIDAIYLCNNLKNLDDEVLSKTDLAHMLEAVRLIRKIDYDTDKSTRAQELLALRPIIMNVVNKVEAKVAENKNDRINITTSAMTGRTALLSFRAAQKSISTALGLSQTNAPAAKIMAQNLGSHLSGGHIKHLVAAMGIKGTQGIDKKDVKGILKKGAPIRTAIVDETGTNRTIKNQNKAIRIAIKLYNKSKSFMKWSGSSNSILVKLLKIILAIVIIPVKLVIDASIDAYKSIKSWMSGASLSQKKTKHFSFMIIPQSEEAKIAVLAMEQVVPSNESTALKRSNSMPSLHIRDYPEEKNPFAESTNLKRSDSTPSLRMQDYPEEKNPFAWTITPVKQSVQGVTAQSYPKVKDSFASHTKNTMEKNSTPSDIHNEQPKKQKSSSWELKVERGSSRTDVGR